jgi:putative ABC transport system substrate-binding protein
MTKRWRHAAILLALAGQAAVADAQQPARIPRVGFVAAAHPAAVAARTEAFRQGLKELGYVEGRNIVVDYRYAAEQFDRVPALVDELIRLKADVIVSAGPSVTRSARTVTLSVPIVMAFDADPVGSGVIASLARPGGNVTGLSIVASDLSGKTLELLKSVVPRLARVVVFENSIEPGNAQTLRATREAAEALGVSLQVIDVRSPSDIEPAFLAATRGGADALVVLSSPLILFHRAQIAGLAATHRLPAIYPYADVVDAGGLMTYGVVFNDLFRRAAGFVDRILKGAKPADLPVEQPTKFELVINRGAAKRIGLVIPTDVLARADRIVD